MHTKYTLNYHENGSLIYLQILPVPSLMHYIVQQVLCAAFYYFADQIQVFGTHSATITWLYQIRNEFMSNDWIQLYTDQKSTTYDKFMLKKKDFWAPPDFQHS